MNSMTRKMERIIMAFVVIIHSVFVSISERGYIINHHVLLRYNIYSVQIQLC